MANNPIKISLEPKAIVGSFPIFEKDQVLTCDDLNQLAGYADDAERLTRVQLLGVGIVTGLRVSRSGAKVSLSAGLGVTTDGDLVYTGGVTYDRFKPYDSTRPVYPPFYQTGKGTGMWPAHELLLQGGPADGAAQLISQLPTSNLIAVLLVESYDKDSSLCTGSDCDNKGGTCLRNDRLILVDVAAANALKEQHLPPLPALAWGALYSAQQSMAVDLTIERVVMGPGTATGDVRTPYVGACNSIRKTLAGALAPPFWNACRGLLGDVFSSDPTTQWIAALNEHAVDKDMFPQSFYDHLKNVATTFDEFREQLFGDLTWAVPDCGSFPKHLMLGSWPPAEGADANRTRYYPSPVTSRSADSLAKVKFLARRLDALINGFIAPAGRMAGIAVVTPSRFEDAPLGDRAIHCYYSYQAVSPVWNYSLNAKGLANANYGYEAAGSGWALGAAANPLRNQIGRFPFFRIEGHQAASIDYVMYFLGQLIAAENLPFQAQGVFVVAQERMLADFATEVASNETPAATPLDTAELAPLIASQAPRLTPLAAARLRRVSAGGTIGVPSPSVPIVIPGPIHFPIRFPIPPTIPRYVDSLPWDSFLKQHPQVEHHGGVLRGGTFILVYHQRSRQILGDFMIPYVCCQPLTVRNE